MSRSNYDKPLSVTGEELKKCAGYASCISVRIYNLIREVGHGNLTADNALHQLVEDVKNASDLCDRLLELSDSIPWDGKGTKK